MALGNLNPPAARKKPAIAGWAIACASSVGPDQPNHELRCWAEEEATLLPAWHLAAASHGSSVHDGQAIEGAADQDEQEEARPLALRAKAQEAEAKNALSASALIL